MSYLFIVYLIPSGIEFAEVTVAMNKAVCSPNHFATSFHMLYIYSHSFLGKIPNTLDKFIEHNFSFLSLISII